jgi:fused signal recognition particle receptor
MQSVLIAIVVIAVIAVLYFVLAKKEPEALPEKEKAKPLPPKKEKEGPTLSEKLEGRRAEMARPEKDKAEAPAPSKAEKDKEKAKSAEAPAAPEPAPEPVAPAAPKAPPPRPVASAPRDVAAVRRGLAKARSEEGFFGRLSSLVSARREIDPALVSDLEDVLLSSDVGVKSTEKLLGRVRDGLARNELSDPDRVWDALRNEARKILSVGGGGVALTTTPTIVLMVGVNGAGKTTTIGKIATKLGKDNRKVILAAGDTFRAAAVQQLEVWGKRVGCDVVKGKDGGDPAAVVFDAASKAKESSADVVLVDTAGRLHTKTPLMDELKKIAKSLGKAVDGAPHETLLVIDATNGQNALAQAKQFKESMPLTGIILTKLDGTAKGGVILAICDELEVPVRYIGLGERPDDLHEFDADEYVEALFGDLGKGSAAALAGTSISLCNLSPGTETRSLGDLLRIWMLIVKEAA